MLPCCTDGLCTGELLENIEYKPREVFLNDFMFLLCQECDVPWQPPCECTYEIHPASPLNLNIRHYVQNSYRKIYADMELYWFNYIRKCEKEGKNKKFTASFDEFGKMFLDDCKKRSGKVIEDCDDNVWICPFDQMKKGGVSDRTMIQACAIELKRRRSRLFNFLIHQDIHDVFSEILQTALCCIVLYELGMADAMFSGVTSMVQVFEEYFTKTGRSFDSVLNRISRLTSKLPHDNCQLCMIDKLYEVFACDLLYFMCSMYEVKWNPSKCKTYTIDTKSPLSLDVQTYIEKSLPDPEDTFNVLYSHYLKKKSILKAFFLGVPLIMEEIAVASVPHGKSVEDLFLLVLNTARMSIDLHKRRLPGGIKSVYQQLPNALCKCNKRNKGQIFDLFNAFAKLENQKKDVLRKVKPLDARYFLHLCIL